MRRAGITVGSLEVSAASLAIDPAYVDGYGKYFQVNDGSFNEVRSATTSSGSRRHRLTNATVSLFSEQLADWETAGLVITPWKARARWCDLR
jgi:hypothetical protein